MTDPVVEPPELQDLIDSVNALKEQLKKSQKELADLRRSNLRQRLGLIVASIGLVLDLAISGVLIAQHEHQNCTNDRSKAFFKAEIRKVEGQVAGFTKLKKASLSGDQKGALAGFDQFVDSSKAYLTSVRDLPNC